MFEMMYCTAAAVNLKCTGICHVLRSEPWFSRFRVLFSVLEAAYCSASIPVQTVPHRASVRQQTWCELTYICNIKF